MPASCATQIGGLGCPGHPHRAARIEELAFNRFLRGLDTLESMASPKFGHAFERIPFVTELNAQPAGEMRFIGAEEVKLWGGFIRVVWRSNFWYVFCYTFQLDI